MKKAIIAAAMLAASIPAFAGDIPAYPGGKQAMDKFIAKTMVYPEAALEMGVEGIVTVEATISPEGKVTATKIVRLVDPDLEKEAVRIVMLMPAWIPADKDGTPVEAKVQVPVKFTIPDPE